MSGEPPAARHDGVPLDQALERRATRPRPTSSRSIAPASPKMGVAVSGAVSVRGSPVDEQSYVSVADASPAAPAVTVTTRFPAVDLSRWIVFVATPFESVVVDACPSESELDGLVVIDQVTVVPATGFPWLSRTVAVMLVSAGPHRPESVICDAIGTL